MVPIGRGGIDRLLEVIADTADDRIPTEVRACLEMLVAQLTLVKAQILDNDRQILASTRATGLSRRLMEISGVGPLVAGAFVASVAEPAIFQSGRNLAAWIGLVPKQNSNCGKNSSGGRERLGGITKARNRYLRQMLIVGAMAVIRHAERHVVRRGWEGRNRTNATSRLIPPDRKNPR